MTIDSHQHFWKYNANKHAWIDKSMELLKKDFMPMDLAPLLQKNNIDGCIAVQADQSEVETDFLLECAKDHPFIKGVVGWLDLCGDAIEDKLEEYAKNKTLKGLRHIVQDEPDDFFMLRPKFMRGISLLARYGLTYDILIKPKHLSSSFELARTFPEQSFVLDHIAKPNINGSIDPYWAHYLEELGQLDNVFCKVSGMVTETTWGKWQPTDFFPYLDMVFEYFGSDRIMFGSDWPVCLVSGNYEKVLEIVQKYLLKLPKEACKKVMGYNAISFYDLTI